MKALDAGKRRTFFQLIAVTALLIIFSSSTTCFYSKIPSTLLFCSVLLALYLVQRDRNLTFRQVGFRTDNFSDSFKHVLLLTVPVAVVGGFVWSLFFPIYTDFYKEGDFWVKLLIRYPIWALIQQYLVLGFFFYTMERLLGKTNVSLICFSSALFFSALHFPNYPLMLFCFIAGGIWALSYRKNRNLITIAISHALLGTIASNILLIYCNVGFDAEPERWTKQRPAEYALDTVNNTIADEKHFPIIIKSKNDIRVSGWARGNSSEIEKVYVNIQGKNYKADYGYARQDAADYLGTPDDCFIGYTAKIPMDHLQKGTCRVSLRMKLAGRTFLHKPGKVAWIRIE